LREFIKKTKNKNKIEQDSKKLKLFFYFHLMLYVIARIAGERNRTIAHVQYLSLARTIFPRIKKQF